MNALKNYYMRGDFMRMVRNIMKFMTVITMLTSLFGCATEKPQPLDKTGMVYKDSDYRSIYANVFDFDNYDGQPMFAVPRKYSAWQMDKAIKRNSGERKKLPYGIHLRIISPSGFAARLMINIFCRVFRAKFCQARISAESSKISLSG